MSQYKKLIAGDYEEEEDEDEEQKLLEVSVHEDMATPDRATRHLQLHLDQGLTLIAILGIKDPLRPGI